MSLVVSRQFRSAQELAHMYDAKLLPDDVFPNPVQLDEWVEKQSGLKKQLARKMAEAVIEDFVDFPTFIESLGACIKHAENGIGSEPFGLAFDGDLTKSGAWVAQLAKPLFRTMPKVIRCHDFIRSPSGGLNRSLTEQEQVTRWIFVDDGAYSGDQLSCIIRRFAQDLLEALPQKNIEIYLAVPCMMTRAIKLLTTSKEILPEAASERLKVIACPAKTMRAKSEIFASLSQEDKELEEKERKASSYDVENRLVVSFLAHKVPDTYSREMMVPLPRIKPPYKKEAYQDEVYRQHHSSELYDVKFSMGSKTFK